MDGGGGGMGQIVPSDNFTPENGVLYSKGMLKSSMRGIWIHQANNVSPIWDAFLLFGTPFLVHAQVGVY